MPREVLYRILLFVNPAVGHSVERVHALAVLYDEITLRPPSTWSRSGRRCATEERAAAQHRPLLWNDETRGAHGPRRRATRRSLGARAAIGATRPQRCPEPAAQPRNDVEKIPSVAVLDLDDPDVGIEFHLAREIGLDRRIGRRLARQGSA